MAMEICFQVPSYPRRRRTSAKHSSGRYRTATSSDLITVEGYVINAASASFQYAVVVSVLSAAQGFEMSLDLSKLGAHGT